jgi:hypothetical protein
MVIEHRSASGTARILFEPMGTEIALPLVRAWLSPRDHRHLPAYNFEFVTNGPVFVRKRIHACHRSTQIVTAARSAVIRADMCRHDRQETVQRALMNAFSVIDANKWS